jgi:hypothetical protein
MKIGTMGRRGRPGGGMGRVRVRVRVRARVRRGGGPSLTSNLCISACSLARSWSSRRQAVCRSYGTVCSKNRMRDYGEKGCIASQEGGDGGIVLHSLHSISSP